MNILIIDDDSLKANWSKKEIAENFKNVNFFYSPNGVDGIAILKKEHIDFIILDMQFSYFGNGLNSEEACISVLKEIRDNPYINENIPVCICSQGGRWTDEFDKFENVVSFIRYRDNKADEKYKELINRYCKINDLLEER